MKLPLFAHLRMVKNCRVPDEVRHSPILSAHWRWEQGLSSWDRWHPPFNGIDAIDAVVSRIFRESGPVRLQDVADVRRRLADRVYEYSAQSSQYIMRHVIDMKSGCFARNEWEDSGQRLFANGRQAHAYRIQKIKTPVVVAKHLPCRFCAKPVFYNEQWRELRIFNRVRCNGPDCRRMAYLENTSLSRGGIQLTPTQRKYPRSLWPALQAANYLNLKSKELKNGKRQHLSR